MNQNSKRILTGLHQIQQENKIQPDRRERERRRRRRREKREKGRPFHLMACKTTSGLFPFQIKTRTKTRSLQLQKYISKFHTF